MKSQNPEWRRGSQGWPSQAYGNHVEVTSASDHCHTLLRASPASHDLRSYTLGRLRNGPHLSSYFLQKVLISAGQSWLHSGTELLCNAVPFQVGSCEDLGAASSGILLPVPGESVAHLPLAQLLKGRKCFIITAGSPVVPRLLSAASGTCSSLSYHLVLGNSLCLCSRP